MLPHPPATLLPHCSVQFTPPGAMSLVTVALTEACVVPVNTVGGAWANTTDGEAAPMGIDAIAEFAGVVAKEDATIVTLPLVGAVLGAV